MKWVAISGSWRKTNEEVENDVRQAVREIIKRGDGIVTGGALNVDYFATDEALKVNPEAKQNKRFVCLYFGSFFGSLSGKRADEGVITHQQAEELITQLTALKKLTLQLLLRMKRIQLLIRILITNETRR